MMQTGFLDHTKSKLGEGPTYDPKRNVAWWFDIEGSRLFEHDFATNQTESFALPFMASMLAVVNDNQQLIATEGGLFLREEMTGQLILHHPLESGKPDTRSNDGRVHPCGALWIGTMGKQAENSAGAIYHFFMGKLTRMYSGITIPNAICFSPDQHTAYFADSILNKIMRVAIDPQTALPIGRAEVFFEQGTRKGALDGVIVDRSGNLWVAVWGGSCLQKISDTGKLIDTITLPVTQPTCPCFVGGDLDGYW